MLDSCDCEEKTFEAKSNSPDYSEALEAGGRNSSLCTGTQWIVVNRNVFAISDCYRNAVVELPPFLTLDVVELPTNQAHSETPFPNIYIHNISINKNIKI